MFLLLCLLDESVTALEIKLLGQSPTESHSKWLSWPLIQVYFVLKLITFFFLCKRSCEGNSSDLKEEGILQILWPIINRSWVSTRESGTSRFWQLRMAGRASWIWANGNNGHWEWGFCHSQGHSPNSPALCPQETLFSSFLSSSLLLTFFYHDLNSGSSGSSHGNNIPWVLTGS